MNKLSFHILRREKTLLFYTLVFALKSSEVGLIITLWIKEQPGAVSLRHRPFKIIFNGDDLGLAGDSFIIVMF